MDFDGCRELKSALGTAAVIVMDKSTDIIARHGAHLLFLQARELRPVHALPRGHGLDVAGPDPHGRRPRAQARDRHADGGYAPRSRAIPSAPSATAPPGRCRGYRAISATRSKRRIDAYTAQSRIAARSRAAWRRSNRMTKLIVDGKEIDVPPEYTLLQACEAAGAEIPRFCFHERLSIAGNCRMCLVEVVGHAEAAGVLRDGRARSAARTEGRAAKSHQHEIADGAQGARRGDGVPADQSSARLPDLRPGRRMRPAGPGHGLWGRFQPLSARTSARSRTNISASWSRPS